MEPVITTDFALVRDEPALVHPRSVFLVSRMFDYRLMQLRDMAPGSPNVAAPPYNDLPAPHLLLGYQYMHRVLNDYLFENRVFMQIGYDRTPGQRPPRLFWTCLTDCSYAVNVGQYMRFLDLDNFHGTFTQMHHAVLMDRVTADMARVHMRGRGVDVGREGEILPVDADAHGYLGGAGASGLQNTLALRLASGADADLLAAIRRLRIALCHFLFCHYYDNFGTEQAYRFLPGSDVYALDNWLTLFTEAFSDLDTAALIERAAADPTYFLDEPAEIMIRCFVSAISGEPRIHPELLGGALQLRNRRVSSRSGLRPRGPRGRAITASQLGRQRRRVVREFVDRLPRRTRRRRAPAEEPAPMEVERVEEEEEAPEDFLQEVLRTVLEAIDALQEELTPLARRHDLFQFTNRFYQLMLDARDAGMVTESFLRKWVLYFFLAEHVASTLYYLYTHFISNREFRRYVDIPTLQVLITGWDVNAQQIFKRIWSEQSNPATIFETLWERILRDFALMVERTGQFVDMDEADQQLFLSDIQYRDRSGDIEEVLKQLNLSEELIDSIDISFRIKYKGIVAIATNNRIKQNLRDELRRRNAQRRGEVLP